MLLVSSHLILGRVKFLCVMAYILGASEKSHIIGCSKFRIIINYNCRAFCNFLLILIGD